MLKLFLAGLCLLAAIAHAAPRRLGEETGYEEALQAREAAAPLNVHQSRQKPSVPLNVFAANEVWFSSNWGGIVKIGSNITKVSGIFTVPQLQLPTGGNTSTTYGASAWVGIDGWTCSGKILQVGIDMNWKNGATLYSGWYEWLPGYANSFTGFNISAGDSIEATVVATSTTSGSATLQNLSTGQMVSHTFNGGVSPLCNVNAEWIVEDYPIAGTSTLVPLVNFNSLSFHNIAYTANGTVMKSITGPTTVDMTKKANCKLSGLSRVNCNWLGS